MQAKVLPLGLQRSSLVPPADGGGRNVEEEVVVVAS